MDLKPFYFPESVAVIGVSLSNQRHPANVIFNKNLLRYPVRAYAVNPKGGSLQNEKVYKSVNDLPEAIDLAVIAVRAEHVFNVFKECVAAGVKAATVITGGFAEVGQQNLQDQLVALGREADFPFVGPNCLGIYSPGRIDTFFIPSERMVSPRAGNVAIVSQSGGVLVDLLVRFAEESIGISSAISIGNKALVREEQLLAYLDGDPSTSVIVFYVEGFGRREGRSFVKAAARCKKPVIVMKAGKTSAGGQAVSSHTASLAGDYKVFSDIMSQYGVVEALNDLELVSFSESLSFYERTIAGKIGIITGSGGHGAMAVDACLANGMEVPVISETKQQELRAALSASTQTIASLTNPVDLTGSAIEDDFVTATQALGDNDEIDCLLVLMLPYLPAISSDIGARLSMVHKKLGKPLVAYVPHVEKYKMLIEGFELNNIPVSSSLEGSVLMAKALRRNKFC